MKWIRRMESATEEQLVSATTAAASSSSLQVSSELAACIPSSLERMVLKRTHVAAAHSSRILSAHLYRSGCVLRRLRRGVARPWRSSIPLLAKSGSSSSSKVVPMPGNASRLPVQPLWSLHRRANPPSGQEWQIQSDNTVVTVFGGGHR
jgi:hypothetical protein